MFGQHWTMTEADIVKYTFNTTVNAAIKIQGQTPENIEELEIAAFHNGVLRGVASPVVETLTGQYVAYLVVYSSNIGELITFKLYDPSIDKVYDTDYTINFTQTVIGEPIDPVIINFYTKHWNYVYNPEENYMALPCIIKVDGNLIDKSNYEIAAFSVSGNQLRGVANPELEPVINIYKAMLKIDGTNGEKISFRLFDVDAQKELETDYTIPYDFDYFAGDVEIEFKNNPVARIGEEGNAARYFATLEAAVAAAQNGETIVLLQDVNLTGTLTIEKSITIDGNGFEILPADDSKTYSSAIMVGNSGWGDDHGEVITLNNIKLNNWKTNYGVVRAQGVTLNMTACEFNGNDVSNAAYGVLSLNFTDATVMKSIFKQNTDRAIDINYNADGSNAVVTIDDCTFEENASEGAGIVVRNDGEELVVTNSKFLNNTVTTTGNAAVLYAGWGTEDQITGCYFYGNNVTTSHATTKRFASAIFCDGCTMTGNAFEANTATRNGETITTTVAVGAFYGAANISENYWGGNAPVPGENYTVEYTNNNVAVNNYYKEYSEGTLSDKVTLNNVAKAGKYYYESITAAFAAVQDGETVTMLHDVSLSESIKVNNNITLDLNGKTITGTDNETGSFALFEVQPSKELTVKDENNTGKITLTATNNRGWNAYSSVISNQRGKLTVNGGTIEHLGGTDMAYAIDNLTNGKATSAITTIKGGTIESKYIGIRQFLNGVEATNELNITAGSINGENSAIYFQSPSVKANTGTLVITSATPIINNRIYMDVTEGATEWPVEVSIDASALAQGVEIVTSNIPAGYELKEIDGVYSVYHGVAKIGNNYYDDLSSALNAITSGCTLDILTDITIASDWDCRNTGAKIGVPVTINGNGKTIKFTGNVDDKNWNTLFRFEDVATVKNLTLDASAATGIQRGITFKKSVTVDNCTLIGNGTTARYAVIVGEGAGAENIGNVTANITNSTFKNWKNGVTDNMNGQDMKEFAITGCTFDNTDVIISAKDKVTFTGNNMSSNSYVNITSYTVPNNVQVVANNNTNLAANTETECNQIAAPLANINAQDGFLTPVAEAGGKYYVTLQGAVNGVADSGTITLLSDIELAAQDAQELFKPAYNRESYCGVYIPDDKTVVLELNGKTVSYLDTKDDVDNVMVMNLGNLTINDNSAEKTGKITYKPVAGASQYAKFYSTIFNCGTLTVNAGTIENTAEAETDVTNAVDNHSRLSHEYDNNSILIVNGGTLSGAYYYAIRQYTHYFEGVQNRVVINDGNINGGIYMQHGDSWYYANAESNRLNVDCYLEIKGGNINVNTTSDAFGKIKSRLFNPDNNAFGLNISGGIINVPVELLVQRGVYYANGVSGTTVPAETPGTRNAEWLAKNDGFVQGGTFSQIGGEEEHTTNLELFLKKGYKLEANTDGTYGVVVDPDYGMVAKIGETRYETLSKAFADVQEGQTIELLPVTIEQGTVKLPATLKNVTVKGVEGAVLKDMTIMAADGNSINYEGITFDGVVFENSCISVTGWRINGAVVKNFTVTNCVFKNLDNTTNVAPVHFNMAATEPVNGFTFTNNVIDGATGGSKSGVYAQVTGKTVFTNNVINNVSFRPYVIQLTTDDGIADNFTVTGNTFSGSAAGRAQGLGNNAEGTDAVTLTVSNNIFKGITNAQQICYWNFNEATTTATLEKNYYDIDVMANPDRIYYNSPAQNISELSEMGIFPIYTELNADGTINEESLFNPVAYVGTKAFETLDEAVDEVTENNNTIVVIANVENVNHLIIPAGKNVVLDLNGKTISGVCNTSSEHNADLIEVENTATLTIKDSSENEEGKVTYASGTYKTGFTVDVKGNLILESGTIELTDSWSLGFAVDVRPNAWGTAYTEASTFVMNGGKVVSSDTGVRIDSNSGETNPSSRHGVYFTMNGGDIISDWDAIFIQHRYANDLYVNIAENAGTIQGKNSPLRIYGDGVVSDVEINIAGGTFDYTGDEGTTGWVVEKFLKATEAQVEAAKIEITGGTFDADVSRFCAFNYVCTSNGDGTYGIEYKQQENNAFVISTLHELEAFRDAVNAGNDFADQTVVLSAGVDLNPTRAINIWEPIGTQANPFKGTFDGGDNTISNLVVEGENNVGLFGYADNATIKNVKLENVNVKGTDCVGAIAGQVYSTSLIDNCHVSGSIQVEGQTNVGGIVGKYYTKVKNCSVIGDGVATSYVKGTYVASDLEGDNIGGIMGHGGEDNRFENNTVKNITISGTRKVAGIVGVTDMNTQVKNCVVENVNIETTATTEYANSKKNTMSNGTLVGSYTTGNNTTGTVESCVVKNVNFLNPNNAVVSVGPITGGLRGGTDGMLAPTGVTASGNNIYMSTITGSNNLFLMNPVAKIGTTEYYTLFDAVAAVQDGETTITMLRNTAEEFAIDNTTANITLDMAGNTLTGAITPSKANLTINGNGGKIINNNSNVSAIEINEGSLNLSNVNIESKRHGVRIDGAVTATINGGEYRLSATSGTRHAVNVSGAANVTITDGIFVGPKGTTMDSGSAVNVQTGAKVTIEDGDFSKGKNNTLSAAGTGTLIVKGGTFDQVVKGSYLAEGYVCQMNADNKYEVFFAVAQIGETYYETIQEAVEAAENNNEIKLLANIEVTESLVVTKTITLDLNDKTITGTDNNTSGNFYLINVNKGNLTVKDSGTNGTITLVATTERNWSSSSVVIANNQGVLTVDSGTIQHLGGTSMAYAIDNLTNGTIGEATTIINGGNIKSTYFAIRQFANSTSTLNKLVVTGGTIGDTWMQSPNNSVNTAAIEVTGGSITGMCITGVNADLELSVLASALGEDGIYGSMPAGQTLDLTDGVYTLVKAVAQVGENKFGSVIKALDYAITNNAAKVVIVSDSRELMPTDVELRLNADLEITAEQPYTVKFYNNGTSYDFVVGSYNSNTLTFGENVTFQLEDRIIWLGYYGNDVDVVVNGTLAAKQIWHGANTQVTSTGTIKSIGEAFVMRRGATLTVNGGGTVNASYFNILAGNIDAENANITCGAMWIANTGNYIYEGNVDINIKSSTLTSNGNLKSSTAHADGVSINFENSEVTFVLFDGYGVSDIDANTKLNVKGASANVSIKGLTNNGLVNVTEEAKLTLTGTITNNGAMKLDATSVIYAPENLGVTIDDNDYDVVYENGAYRAVHKPFVAQVEDEQFTSLQRAFEAVQDNGTITLLRDVTFDLTTVGYQDENWVDGVRYNGDKSFTVNFNTYKVTDNGCVNDYLININNKGEKDNEITFTNGTIESANGCWATVCVGAESSTHKTVLNLNDMNIINENDASYSGNLAVRVRGTADVNTTVNVNTGTTITSDGASYGIAPSTNGAVVNINSGAIIEQKNSGTSGGNSVFAAVGGKGTVNIYDGAIIGSDSYGVHTMTTGTPVVNIYGGTITAEVALKASTNGVDGQSSTINVSGGMITGALEEYTDNAQIILTGGKFSTDVNEYCHEYYDAVTEDNITWTVEQVLFAQTTELQAGWNWYSSYINLASDEELVEMQNAFDGKGLEIKGKTGFSDYQYIGDDVNGVAQYKWYKTEDFSISAKQMYMIKTTEALDLVVDGKVVNPAANPISLKVGWNWIGYPMTENVAINVALENLEAEPGDVIKSRNGESEYIEGYGWYGDILTMEPGVGYKYYSQKRTTFVYNSTADNSRYVNENVTPDNNYWLPEVSQYADNMSIVAMLNIDGEIAKDNYEIAAFVNGECRGSARPVYIEALDVYVVFMMVFGEESEELSFKYYDVDYETEYELNDVITYCSDSRIGSVNNPYMFNLDILNIDESSVEDINIYPNPTTTGSEINLQAVCDKVEVFNALGVKVAEYTNVDSIDAIETAGVYVIRLTIDNSARNCRLIVK